MASHTIDLHKRVHTIINLDKCYVDWNSTMMCGISDDTSAQISPSRDDELKIRYIQYKITEHTLSPNSDACSQEDWMLPPTTKVITVRRSELNNFDSASIMQSSSGRMIVDFINTHYPPQEKEDIPNVLARIIDVVQNCTPLVPNDFIDVRRIEGLEIMHQMDDQVTEDYLCHHFATKSGTCSICLDDFEVGRNTSRLPCLHVFHGPCIFQWLEKNHSCPICWYTLDSKYAPWFNA
ncbi:uncharacterized protein LOC126796658 [Argentina anserina]|uniref:uncharacterized protein LOC126796658 n=1 Tax=Argentina anserina TaxID=57926 RepID=UPI0021764B6B|nr:uncharacterized protein LOC126796658 [Potentilla anserina]